MKSVEKKALLLRLLQERHIRHRRKAGAHGASDTSSMGDVAFLLLIFFIVTTSFILRQGIFFTLPSKSEGAQKIEEKMLMKVYPQEDGFVYNDKKISRDEFEEQVEKRFGEEKGLVVLVFMKEDVPYNRLVDTLSLVKEKGVTRVSVKTVREESS